MAGNIWSDHPLLLISHGEDIERHIIYNVSDYRYHILKFPALKNKKVLGSSHGWLVLAGHEDDRCCLFNPITKDVIELPDLEDACWYHQCILTKPPTEPDSHILFNAGVNISFCRIGDTEFVRLSYRKEDSCCLVGMGYFQGQIYGYMIPGNQLVTIHFVEKALEFRPIKLMVDGADGFHPWLIPPSLFVCDIWLIESYNGGAGAVELLMIYKTYLTMDVKGGLDFRVFGINTDLNTCTEIVDIGKRAIFLSHNGCGYCCGNAIEGVKHNSIYYTNWHMSGDRNVHVFDLKDKSTTSRLPSRAVGRYSFTSWVHITN